MTSVVQQGSPSQWYSTAAILGGETMLLVVPLRLGIFSIAWITFFSSLFQMFDHSITQWFQDISRYFIGGYGHGTELVANVISGFGCLFSLAGVSGTWHQRAHLVGLFGSWQVVRIVLWGGVYVADLMELYYCELWVNDVRSAATTHWNERMYRISLNGDCATTRMNFAILAMGSILLSMYLAYHTFRLQGKLSELPKHLLRINKEPPPSVYYAVSKGERPGLRDDGGPAQPHLEPMRPSPAEAYGATQAPGSMMPPPPPGSMVPLGAPPPPGSMMPSGGPPPGSLMRQPGQPGLGPRQAF
eukprot:CAMPEP_0178426712 /NCGR_PEP_ID=MMETSP0689_2-20121128/29374_1 /TAXON_ID=160604 /ORGANISM="Amphidinium massartii, Strain CS-259" /LENGTH=300 /DNA_ID=CAMNT_0020048403 /DNA_START=151 /DNA_END=1050 /DNA_ORIENTATION=+